MLLIAHRGNTKGQIPSKENHPDYIMESINAGFNVEIDVWLVGDKWFLGHDSPQHEVDKLFLQNKNIWCHVKNEKALSELVTDNSIHYFWHNNDDYMITSRGYIWCYPGKFCRSCIMNQPEKVLGFNMNSIIESFKPFGLCSDYVGKYGNI